MTVARTGTHGLTPALARFRDAWLGGDPQAVAALYRPEGERHDAGFGEVARGRAAIAAAAGAFMEAFGDRSLTLRPLDAGPDGWACEIAWSAVHAGPFRGLPPCRRRVEFSGLSVGWTGQDGLLAVEKWYSDAAVLMRNLGGRV